MASENGTGKIRYAVVGVGNIAQIAVLPAFEHASENSELVALVSGDPDKREELGRRYGISATGDYDEFERVLEGASVDAAYIALPNDMHREFTERAARAGVHVVCEKPMAITEEDCEAMIGAAEDASVKLMIAYRLHFEEGNLEAVELVRSGKLGDVRLFDSVFSHDVREGDIRTLGERGGGALYDLGVYCINAARYLFRAEPVQAFAYTIGNLDERSRNVDDTTAALLRFPGNRIAQFTVSQSLSGVSSFRVVGTNGDLLMEPAYKYAADLKHYLTTDDETKERTFPKRDQFAPELIYFSQCILEDRDPEPDGYEGLADVRVIRALFRSAEIGAPVEIPPFERRRRPTSRQELARPPIEPPQPMNAPSPTK